MALDSTTRRSRRVLLAGIAGGTVAAAAQALGRPAAVFAGVDGDVVLGTANAATTATNVANTTNDANVVEAVSTHGGIGVLGSSATNSGVFGTSASATEGGVVGVNTGLGPGVAGSATGIDAAGVLGSVTGDGAGVHGINNGQGPGVLGTSTASGPAVRGTAATTGQGGLFEAPLTGTALRVIGKARFSRSGVVFVAAGRSTVTITMAGVGTSSFIIATPQTNRPGVYVQSVVASAGSFTIHLNRAAPARMRVGYLVLN